MKKLKQNKGITLIALIVTIIILLILAGVTINILIGDNGLFNTAKIAGESYEEAGAREKLEAVLVELQADKITKLEYNEKDYIDNKLKENNMQVDGDIAIVDGWQFELDRSVPQIGQSLGKETEIERITRGKAKFVYDAETQNVAKVEVTIEIDESVSSKYTVQYNMVENSDGSEHWVDYVIGNKIDITKNITIYGRIINKETGEIGYKFSSKITNIDMLPPQSVEITFDKESADINTTIQATVTQSDLESGIDIENCKYIVNNSKDEIGKDKTDWDSATSFTDATQIIDITKSVVGKYYVHVLSVDNAGNKIEKVSTMIRFKGTVSVWSGDLRPSSGNGGFWIYSSANNSNSGYYLKVSGYGNSEGRAISKNKVNVSDFDTITCYTGFMCGDDPSMVRVSFELCTNSNGTGIVKSVNFTNLPTTSQLRYLSVNMPVNGIDGSYYLCIRLTRLRKQNAWPDASVGGPNSYINAK
ncbi:MAG: hypothetical protein HFJ58_01755 [Clostridia bacterium]|nr:hypothetical protein [Clostridia bacterium]